MSENSLRLLISKLRETAKEVRALERAASEALYEQGDRRRYADILRQKSQLLLALPDVLESVPNETLPHGLRAYLRDRLGGMSFSAEKALTLDSLFYMGALLYPADYRPGDKNDLENTIDSLLGMELPEICDTEVAVDARVSG